MAYVAVAVIWVLFGWFAYRLAYLQLRGIRTKGTIIELVRDDTNDGDTFSPVVTYTTQQGVVIRAKSSFGTPETGSFFRVGERVDIWYAAKNPQHFLIVGYDVSALVMLGLLAVGVTASIYYFHSK
ncbi:MAG: DUF3592 domain-containing protein [Bacteroidota bacterium]|nr:DUF3592 domain-containing protein [Bacteroidota bacterium]